MMDFNFASFVRYAQEHFPALCQARAADSHKGSYGSIGVLGGAPGMVGAPILAARTALKLGTGRVYIGFAQETAPIALDPLHAEIMLKSAHELLKLSHLTSLVLGCGLGLDEYAKNIFALSLKQFATIPMVIDADALSLLAQEPTLLQAPQAAIRILTPHPSEAARLLGWSTEQIQADRHAALQALLQRYQQWIVLKGHQTLIGSPDGEVYTNPSGNPGLASGGTGDVLAGMIAALLAQAVPAPQAIVGATWLHGAAADYLVSQGIGPIGLSASEVLIAARTLRNVLVSSTER